MNGDITISDALPMFTFYQYYSYPVVDENGRILGMLKRYMLKRDIVKTSPNMKVSELVKSKPIPMLYQNDSLDIAIKFLGSYETSVLPVMGNRSDNKVAGIITHTDIIKFYSKENETKNKIKLVNTIDNILETGKK